VIAGFIDENRELGVEPICRALQVAPSTYYARKARPASARTIRDAMLVSVLTTLWTANYKVYGVRKLWRAAQRTGHDVGRDQVARLMKLAGIEGLRKGKKHRTTRPDPGQPRHPDLVHRSFGADAPDRLWVTDITYVPTWSGFAYACFITDAFSRMIVGWRVAAHMRTDMVLDALEMAAWRRGNLLEGLIAHSDAGSQGGCHRSSQHLDVGGVTCPESAGSSGSRGQCAARSVHQDGRRGGSAISDSGPGSRSPRAVRVRTPPSPWEWHPRLAPGGSERLVGCDHSASSRRPAVTCP